MSEASSAAAVQSLPWDSQIADEEKKVITRSESLFYRTAGSKIFSWMHFCGCKNFIISRKFAQTSLKSLNFFSWKFFRIKYCISWKTQSRNLRSKYLLIKLKLKLTLKWCHLDTYYFGCCWKNTNVTPWKVFIGAFKPVSCFPGHIVHIMCPSCTFYIYNANIFERDSCLTNLKTPFKYE